MKRILFISLSVVALLALFAFVSIALARGSAAMKAKVVVVMYCIANSQQNGTVIETVSLVDGSTGAPPLPTLGSSCAQGLADLMEKGGFTRSSVQGGDEGNAFPTYTLIGRPGVKARKVVVIMACLSDAVWAVDASAGAPPLPIKGGSCAQGVADLMNKGGFTALPIGVGSATYTFIK